jgi:hypothetical protein
MRFTKLFIFAMYFIQCIFSDLRKVIGIFLRLVIGVSASNLIQAVCKKSLLIVLIEIIDIKSNSSKYVLMTTMIV